jgi:hypothetical protein
VVTWDAAAPKRGVAAQYAEALNQSSSPHPVCSLLESAARVQVSIDGDLSRRYPVPIFARQRRPRSSPYSGW